MSGPGRPRDPAGSEQARGGTGRSGTERARGERSGGGLLRGGAGRGGGLGRLSALRGSSATAARTPFVVLVVTLLAGGLISLLLLNSAVNSDSFELNKLQNDTTGYTDEQQALQQEVDGYSAPDELERRARELGMVPGGNPAFLNPDGTVRGTPDTASAPPAPAPTTTAPTTPPPPTATAGPSGQAASPTMTPSP